MAEGEVPEGSSSLGARVVVRLVVWSGTVVGVALLVGGLTSADAPDWWTLAGALCTLVFGLLTALSIVNIVRYREPGAREARIAELRERREHIQSSEHTIGRSKIAHRAAKHRKAVLRSGNDAAATVLFLADGGRSNEFESLVYLELEVTPPGAAPYEVRHGEYVGAAAAGTLRPGAELVVKVDPEDPQRVAVDWERSLRLR